MLFCQLGVWLRLQRRERVGLSEIYAKDSVLTEEAERGFAENPLVYFLITDRFYSSAAPVKEGRIQQSEGIGTFHGGNFSGISKKLREGWFSDLGINAIWISAPYEQIHGWIPGNSGFHYAAYHGYWPLDYTCVETNFGDRNSFAEFVALAHAQGIGVILDIVMSHVGYPDITTLSRFLPTTIRGNPDDADAENYQDFFVFDSPEMLDWWGPDWVCADIPGYEPGGDTDLTRIMFGLPRLLTEREKFVALPAFLRTKTDTRAIDLAATTVAGYLIDWLCQWVREFGVDGFRCDSARHVGLETWGALKSNAEASYGEWRQDAAVRTTGHDGFWMLGEVFGHGLERSAYFDHGFDSVINFDFQHELKQIAQSTDLNSAYGRQLAWMRLDKLYARYARELSDRNYDVVSYISSHDTELFPRPLLHFGATALMLLPGGVQIFYGDETARPPSMEDSGDPAQATRSDMNWNNVDSSLLDHWKKLGTFRRRHPALARGKHYRISGEPYVFARTDARSGDSAIVGIGTGAVRLQVSEYFGNTGTVRDFYTGKTYDIVDGTLEILVAEIALLEKA